ncbi:hypothetical protein [Algoriphagus pacificus]|uniref:6-bladed beta-propeller protein n=1 Tax=Algoriphagus pacificus TaxID=2811234 RepID=A0ABS3CJU8_9BACT|nr:hypothetical protein [Algoriphagus pacificus]MBN7817355.1 hypothetical protein [Algoriphagus pacificus]
MKYFLSFIFIYLLMSGCKPDKDKFQKTEISTGEKVYSLEKLDSIKIPYLGNPTVHDIDPSSRTVLFMEHMLSSQEIILADFDGTIRNTFSKWGDVPDSYGNLIAPLLIDNSNSFIAYGSRGFLTYDFNGELLSRVKHPDFDYFGFNRIGLGGGMEKSGNRLLYVNIEIPDYSKNERKFYEELKILTWLDQSTGEKEPFISFPNSSIFRGDNFFFNNAWDPAFTIADNFVYVVFGVEPVIYSYDKHPPYSLISKTNLELPEYNYFKGAEKITSDVSFFGQRRTSGRILNIKKIGEFFIIVYFPGFDFTDTQEQFENKSREESMLFQKRMNEKYPHKVAILNNKGKVLSHFPMEGFIPGSMVLRDNEIWMLESFDTESEQDYFRIFKFELNIE